MAKKGYTRFKGHGYREPDNSITKPGTEGDGATRSISYRGSAHPIRKVACTYADRSGLGHSRHTPMPVMKRMPS